MRLYLIRPSKNMNKQAYRRNKYNKDHSKTESKSKYDVH